MECYLGQTLFSVAFTNHATQFAEPKMSEVEVDRRTVTVIFLKHLWQNAGLDAFSGLNSSTRETRAWSNTEERETAFGSGICRRLLGEGSI